MQIWAMIKTHQKIITDTVMEFDNAQSEADWRHIISELCQSLQLSRPVLMNKHIEQLRDFGRTAFLPTDFIESVDFDKLEIEVLPEKKKKRHIELL